jgi:hypothetical protein
MIKPVLHLFKIHRKVIFGNPSVIVQHMLRKTPKPLNAVNMILASIGKRFAVVQLVVFAEAVQGVVTAKSVCVVHRAFSGMLSDMSHQFFCGYLFNYLGIYSSVTLQKAQYNAFSCCSSSALALSSSAEVCLINLNLAFQFARFKFRNMVDCLAQLLVYSADRLIVRANVACYSVRRLLLVEAGDDADFLSQLFERLLFSTGRMFASHISSSGSAYLERTAENALSAPQKVGCTVKTIVSTSNHMGILVPAGYFSH